MGHLSNRAVTLPLLAFCLLSLSSVPATALWYENSTAGARVVFQTAGEVHDANLQEDWPAFPEILGGGACFGDFDGDGYQDLFIVNNRFNDLSPVVGSWAAALDPRDMLYLNLGDGTFVDWTDAAGIDGRGQGYACSTADADGDGDLDLFVAQWGADVFYLNDGNGRFVDASTSSGLGNYPTCGTGTCLTQGSAWADYDNDGDLDLYVANYVETDWEDLRRGPNSKIGQVNRLFQNDGNAHFVDVAKAAGVQGNPTDNEGGKSFVPVWEDFDGDGDFDLYVTNDMVPNDYYENLGDGTFIEQSNETGLADRQAGMGLTVGDYDGDCLPDLFFTHYDGQNNGLYRNLGNKTFEDQSGDDDHSSSLNYVGWGTHLADFDLDGDLDIITTNGHTEWKYEMPIIPGLGYPQPLELFRNDPGAPGDPTWVAVHNVSGPTFEFETVGRGLSIADYDLDGDYDFVVVSNNNESATFHKASNVTGNWLRVELRGDGPNTMGVGARLLLTNDGVTQCRRVYAGSGFLGQNDLAVTFGLADATEVDKLVVEWPGGASTTYLDLPVNSVVRLLEANPALVQTDTLSPVTKLVHEGISIPEWSAAPVRFTMVTSDRAIGLASGVASAEYRMDDGPWMPQTNAEFSFADEGSNMIFVRSSDMLGNTAPERRHLIGRDYTPPSTTATMIGGMGSNGWFNSPTVTVQLQATDALSGPESITYRINGGAWEPYVRPIGIKGTGAVYEIEYRATDVAGNVEAIQTVVVKHDPTPPKVTWLSPRENGIHFGNTFVTTSPSGPTMLMVPPAAIWPEPFVVRLGASDAVSGVATQSLHIDGLEVAQSSGNQLNFEWDPRAQTQGPTHLLAEAADAAGNTMSSPLELLVVHDSVSPEPQVAPAGPSGEDAADAKGPLVPVFVLGLTALRMGMRRRP